MRLNLGAGSEPTEGWVNLDWIAGPGIDVVHNLLEFPWPFDDGAVSEIKAIDVLEHMPNFTPDNRAMAIAFVEECWRILQPGGTLFMSVPHWQSKNMWIDPTHVRGFDEHSMDYFDPSTDFGKWYGYYSARKFQVKSIRTPNDNVEFSMTKVAA
jgi:predicted SAM-dependent methyltransferase